MTETRIAVHEERIANMQLRMGALEEKVDRIDGNVTVLVTSLAEIRGGWRTLVALSSVVGAIVGVLLSAVVGKIVG